MQSTAVKLISSAKAGTWKVMTGPEYSEGGLKGKDLSHVHTVGQRFGNHSYHFKIHLVVHTKQKWSAPLGRGCIINHNPTLLLCSCKWNLRIQVDLRKKAMSIHFSAISTQYLPHTTIHGHFNNANRKQGFAFNLNTASDYSGFWQGQARWCWHLACSAHFFRLKLKARIILAVGGGTLHVQKLYKHTQIQKHLRCLLQPFCHR